MQRDVSQDADKTVLSDGAIGLVVLKMTPSPDSPFRPPTLKAMRSEL